MPPAGQEVDPGPGRLLPSEDAGGGSFSHSWGLSGPRLHCPQQALSSSAEGRLWERTWDWFQMCPGIILSLGGHSPLARAPWGARDIWAADGVHSAGEFLLKEQLLLVTNAVHLPPAKKKADLSGCMGNREGERVEWSVCQDMGISQTGSYGI